MTTIYVYALASVFIVSLVSLVGIFTLSLRRELLHRTVLILVSLAAGALLGDAFIHLIPGAFAENNVTIKALFIIGGILFFFLIEKFLHWHHYHGEEEEEKRVTKKFRTIHPMGYMIIVSDGFHNLLDGIIIGVSYLVSIEVGIATTIAVVLHEIPQEIGDFGVLIHSGFTKARALLINFLTALLAIFGAVIALVFGTIAEEFIVWIIPIAAGGFIYIAAVDLIPELHKTKTIRASSLQFIALLVGILAMFFLTFTEGEENRNSTRSLYPSGESHVAHLIAE